MEPQLEASSTRDGDEERDEQAASARNLRRTAVPRRRIVIEHVAAELMRDSATGLVPRVAFNAALQEQLDQPGTVGIIALGLTWNERPGEHVVADATLITAVARRLTSSLRSTDLVASFGSDGFLVLVADAPAPEVLHAMCRRLVTGVSGPVSLMAQQIDVRASASYAMVGREAGPADRLVALASRSWHRARALGGERICLFDMNEPAVVDQAEWSVDELERALQNNEFVAHFQPVVDVVTADLVGFEALTRWEHPTLGVLEPSRFLQAAEDAGLLGRIGTEAMRQAMRHLARWSRRVTDHELLMGVNLSARQLQLPDLSDTVGDLIRASGLPAERLRLDVAEHIVATDLDRVSGHVARLRRIGARVCLDDFGTGSSSMAVLQRLPVDAIKLDRSVLDALDEPTGSAVLEAMVRFGHSLQLIVVAVGVQTPKELAALRTAGCDQAQGRLFSAPRSPREVDELLGRWLGLPEPAGLAS